MAKQWEMQQYFNRFNIILKGQTVKLLFQFKLYLSK